MKTKNRNTLMSTEHFMYSSGCFYVNNRRSFCFGSFLFQIINDLPNHGNTFFFAVKTAFFHIFQIVTENFYQLCLFDVQYKNFTGIVFEDHCAGISADAEMKISREMIQWFLKKTVRTGFAACTYTLPEPVCAV